MMGKRFLLVVCFFFILGYILCAHAQTDKVYKVGISVWTDYPSNVKGFKEAMEAGGFVEGKNVQYIIGKSGLNPALQRQIAQGFLDAHVDLVYSLTTPGTTIIKDVMPPTTPVVFSIVTYPVQQGFIKSYESSGTNLVGTSNYVELDNYVKLRKALLPQLKTLAIFHRKGEPNSKIQADEMRRLSEKEGIQVLDLQPESIGDVRKMALELVGKVDAFMTTTDTLMQGGGEQALIEVSLDKKIPILSSNKAGIEQGSTFGPVADFYVLGKMSGEMAVKILRENAKPSDLKSRIQEPPLILVNRKSAAILGIAIPDKAISNLQYVE